MMMVMVMMMIIIIIVVIRVKRSLATPVTSRDLAVESTAIPVPCHVHLRSPPAHRRKRAARAEIRKKLKRGSLKRDPEQWFRQYRKIANHHSAPFHQIGSVSCDTPNQDYMPQKWECGCGAFVPLACAYCGQCGQRWDKQTKKQPSAKSKPRQDGKMPTPVAFVVPAVGAQIPQSNSVGSVGQVGAVGTNAIHTMPAEKPSKSIKFTIAQPCKQNWKGRGSHRETRTSTGRGQDHLATICPSNEHRNGSSTFQMHGFPCGGHQGIDRPSKRVAWTFDSATQSYAAVANCITTHRHTASHSASACSIDSLGSRQWALSCLYRGTLHCSGHGRGHSDADLWEWISSPKCRHADASIHKCTKPTIHASISASGTNPVRTPHSQSDSAIASTANVSLPSNGSGHTAGQLELATCNAGNARMECTRAYTGKQYQDKWSHTSGSDDSYADTWRVSASVNSQRLRSSIARPASCCHSTDLARVRHITGVSADGVRCSPWIKPTPHRARRRRRTRAHTQAPRTTGNICATAAAMPSRTDEFSWPSSAATSAVTATTNAASTNNSYCTAVYTSRPDDTTAYSKFGDGNSNTHACSKQHEQHTSSSNVHKQLTRTCSDTSTIHEARELFPLATWTKTTEGSQKPTRQCPLAAWSSISVASSRLRLRPRSDSSADRNRLRQWSRTWQRVGLGNCEDHHGPNDLCAVTQGTTESQELRIDVHSLSANDAKVTLSLASLLNFSWQDDALHGASSLFERLCVPWPDNCLIRDNNFVMMLPDLSPEIQWIFKDLPVWQDDPVAEVHIYVDGSCFENRQQKQFESAAWAFIVIVKSATSDSDCCQFFAAVSNPLSEADMSANEFYGVGELTKDPLSAEAAGMLMVQTWICQSPFKCLHVVHYDNCTVGKCAEGTAQWHAKWEHERIHTNLCAMRHCLEAIKQRIRYEHVKAHDGNPMNEVADSLAKATAKGIFGKHPLPVDISRVMHHRHFKYAWMAVSSTSVIPKPAALRGLFKAEGPFDPNKVDTTWWHPNKIETKHDVVVSIQVATANVLTLEPGPKSAQLKELMQQGRISMLQQQFHKAGVHAIGLQECRTQGQQVRHSATHWVFQSGASTEGARGCELWLSKQLPYNADSTKPCFFAAQHVHVAVATDRCLLAIVKAPHFHVRILVTHAPHLAAHDTTCESWWTELQTLVQRIGSHLPLLVLGDMNAKLGSVLSDAVGPLGAEDENGNGCRLHAFALENNLWIPATFSMNHEGTSTTWRSSEGQPHRLDYVLIPVEWKSFDVQSFVSSDIDLCTAREDHAVVCLKVSMLQRQSTSQKLTKPRIDVRKCNDAPAKAKFLQRLQHPPVIPWETGTGQHAEILTAWLQSNAQECFPSSANKPRQRYMSDFTWQIVLLRKQLRKLMLSAEKNVAILELKFWFATWVHWTTSTCPDSPSSSQDQPATAMLQRLIRRIQRNFAWAFFHRQKLHVAARHSSKNDRIQTAKQLVDQFFQVAHTNDSKALYRHLKPLLGQQYRKAVHQFRPIPAVRLGDNSLAKDHDEAANRWQMHFAQAEQGRPVTVKQIQELAAIEQPRYSPHEMHFDLSSIPNLNDIEEYIHRSKVGKSPGADGLPSELYRLAPSVLAQVLWPLMAKSALRCAEPLRWRGGEVCAIPKVLTASTQVEHFRSILLADFSSKISHGMLRRRLLPAIQSYRVNMQAGGIPGLGTDMLHLFVQSFMQHAKHQGVSSAALFIDIKQAFYRACRPLLVCRQISQEHIAQLFADNGWSPTLFQAFQARMAETPALAQASVSSHQIAQVDAMLSTTWFQLRATPQTLTHTTCGTRPGDSIADLLFTFIMSRFLHELRNRFVQADLHNNFTLKWLPPVDLQPGDIETQRVIQACWVDDLVLLLQAPTATELVTKIRSAITIAQDLSVEFGLSLNYGPDKTAVLPSFRGTDADKVRRYILQDNPDRPQLAFDCQSLTTPGRLDVVPTYVYLGQVQDLKGHPAAEVHRRFVLIKASSRLLHRNVFRSPRMPFLTKARLHTSLVMSKLLYGAGAWQATHILTAKSWTTQLMSLYSRIAPTTTRGPNTYNLDILADCGFPRPMMTLAYSRLRLFDRITQTELTELFAILQNQDEELGWFQMILQDIDRLRAQCPDHPIFEAGSEFEISTLGRFCAQQPKALTRFCKWTERHYLAQLQLWKGLRKFQVRLQEDSDRLQLQWIETTQPDREGGTHECPQCAQLFQTFKAMCTHALKKHGVVNMVQKYTASNVCKGCLRVNASRQQVVHHLKYWRTGCLAKLIATSPPLTDEEVAEVLAEQRELSRLRKHQPRSTKHLIPVCQSSGPQRPWPWQRTQLREPPIVSPAAELEVNDNWVQLVLDKAASHEVHSTLQALQSTPFHPNKIEIVLQRIHQIASDEPAAAIEQYLVLHEAISIWQEDHGFPVSTLSPVDASEALHQFASVRIPRAAKQPHDIPVQMRRRLQIDELWLTHSVHWQIRNQLRSIAACTIASPTVDSVLFVQTPIYVYVFSGRRRQGDFQFQVETLLQKYHLRGHVLLLDLAISEEHDVGDERLIQTIITWIHQGAVAGLLLAPPCETWTEARFIEPRSPTDPRPVRSREDPLGLPQCTLKELEQTTVANMLLFVAIRLLYHAAIKGVAAILEHPKEPRSADRAAIWRLPWLQQLKAANLLRQHLIWQANYGSQSLKPTHIGLIHIHHYKTVLAAHASPVDWANLVTLGGKDAQGAWRTAQAKEYPEKLNLAFADLLISAYRSRQNQQPVTPDLPATTLAEFHQLYKGDQSFEQQVMQPDFHPRMHHIDELD